MMLLSSNELNRRSHTQQRRRPFSGDFDYRELDVEVLLNENSQGLLRGTGTRTAWTTGSKFTFLGLKGEHVQQATAARFTGLEQGLFFDRRDIQMEANRINQRGASQATLFNQRLPDVIGSITQETYQQLVQGHHRSVIEFKPRRWYF